MSKSPKVATFTTLGCALIGCGYWGIKILRTLNRDIQFVCETRDEIVEEITKEFPHIQIEQSWEKILANKEIKNVMIALPAELHYTFAYGALQADKNVFVEKPLSIHLKEVEELVNLAKEKNKILTVGHLLHYHPHLREIKKLVDKGAIGTIKQIKAKRQSWGIFRQYDNVLWTVGIHDLSWISSIVDYSHISNLTVCGQNLTNHSDLDLIDVSFQTESGTIVQVGSNWISPTKEQSLYIYGEKGVIFADDVKKDFFITYYDGTKKTIESDVQLLPLGVECQHFLECCQTGKEPETSGEKMLPVYKLLDQINKIWQESSKPKKVDYFAHPTAIIDEDVEIGKGSKLWHHCHLSRRSRVGRECSFGQNSYIGDDVILGDRCRLQNNANVYTGAVVGNDVFFGPGCIITNDKRPRIRFTCGGQYVKTIIEDEVSIGAGAIVIAGVKIGRGAMIGAGSVVTREVEPFTLVIGNPARRVSKIDQMGRKILDPN